MKYAPRSSIGESGCAFDLERGSTLGGDGRQSGRAAHSLNAGKCGDALEHAGGRRCAGARRRLMNQLNVEGQEPLRYDTGIHTQQPEQTVCEQQAAGKDDDGDADLHNDQGRPEPRAPSRL